MIVLMACGHAANATTDAGDPCCVICSPDPRARTVAEKPALEGRRSKCYFCDEITPSRWDLPFFEYRGIDSPRAREICTCGYALVAHTPEKRAKVSLICGDFRPHGAYEFDSHYNGCRGWD